MAEIKSYPNNADEFIGAEYPMKWHHGRTRGVFGAEGNAAVAAIDGQMAVTVSDGIGWLTDANGNGIVWWNDTQAQTAQQLVLNLDTADGTLSRIDRIIVEWSTPNYAQKPEIKVLKGANAVSPAAPALTNDASLRQISLARVSVAAGTLAVTAAMITDERLDAAVCGVVTETVEVDTSMATAQLNEVLAQAQQLVSNMQGEAVIDHAATHEPGGDDETKFVFYGGAQTLSDAQKAQAQANLGAVGFSGAQTLSGAQKAQAQANIGAAGLTSDSKVYPAQTSAAMHYVMDNYMLILSDAGKRVVVAKSTAATLIIPSHANVAFPVGTEIEIVQGAAGTVTITGSSGVTLHSADEKRNVAAQYASVSIWQFAEDEWWIAGYLA